MKKEGSREDRNASGIKTGEGFPARPRIHEFAFKTSPNAARSQQSCCLPEPGYHVRITSL